MVVVVNADKRLDAGTEKANVHQKRMMSLVPSQLLTLLLTLWITMRHPRLMPHNRCRIVEGKMVGVLDLTSSIDY